jgi:MFS family permease
MGKWWPLVAVCAGAFMLLVDVTIVNVALPDMARELNTTFSHLQWVIDLYALVLGALVLTVGAVADRLGRRAVYLARLVLFAVSSLICGLAPTWACSSPPVAFATTMALISNTYQGRDRGVAFGIWGAANGAASAIGPIIGGLLTASFGWRWIFLVNLPVSVIAVALTLRVVTESRDPHARPVDLPGMVTFTVAAGTLTYALIRGAWASGRRSPCWRRRRRPRWPRSWRPSAARPPRCCTWGCCGAPSSPRCCWLAGCCRQPHGRR